MLRIVRKRPFLKQWTHYQTYLGPGNIGNVPYNHTGWTIRSQLRENKLRPGKKELVVVANLNASFPVAADGSVQIEHDAVFTRSLKRATGLWYDVVAFDPDGQMFEIIPPTPAEVVDWPTDPYDNSSNDFIPGGGGAIYHTHPISQVEGLQEILDGLGAGVVDLAITSLDIDADGRLVIVKSGTTYKYTPFSVTP